MQRIEFRHRFERSRLALSPMFRDGKGEVQNLPLAAMEMIIVPSQNKNILDAPLVLK